jgi:hypothetical protein
LGWSDRTAAALLEFSASVGRAVQGFIAEIQALPAKVAGAAAAVGRSIVTGVAAGIRSAPGVIGGALGEAVGNAIAAAQALIRGRSPSQLTAEVIGLPMVQGIAMGIEDNIKIVQNAATVVVGTFMQSFEGATKTLHNASTLFVDSFMQSFDAAVTVSRGGLAKTGDTLIAAIIEGLSRGITDNRQPLQHAATEISGTFLRSFDDAVRVTGARGTPALPHLFNDLVDDTFATGGSMMQRWKGRLIDFATIASGTFMRSFDEAVTVTGAGSTKALPILFNDIATGTFATAGRTAAHWRDKAQDFGQFVAGTFMRSFEDAVTVVGGTFGGAATIGDAIARGFISSPSFQAGGDILASGMARVISSIEFPTFGGGGGGGGGDFMDFAKVIKGSAKKATTAVKSAGVTIGKAVVTGVKESLEELPKTALDIFKETVSALSAMGSTFASLGGTVAKRYTEQFITPVQSRITALQKELATVDQELQDTAFMGQALIPLIERRLALQAELGREMANEMNLRAKLVELERQQANLGFLQQQAKLLETIQQYGLDPRAILGDLRLGLGASIEGLLAAMTRALQGVVGQMNAAVQGADLSLRPATLLSAPQLALAPAAVSGPISVTVYAAPGMDERALVQEVIYQIRREQRTVR